MNGLGRIVRNGRQTKSIFRNGDGEQKMPPNCYSWNGTRREVMASIEDRRWWLVHGVKGDVSCMSCLLCSRTNAYSVPASTHPHCVSVKTSHVRLKTEQETILLRSLRLTVLIIFYCYFFSFMPQETNIAFISTLLKNIFWRILPPPRFSKDVFLLSAVPS